MSTNVDETNPGYERHDAHVASIWKFAAGLFLLIAVAFVMMLGLFRWLYRAEQATTPVPTVMEAQRVLPPAPRLQTTTAADIVELRRREDEVLHNYGWVDRNAGVVRLPIDRAIELIVERGLPTPRVTPPAKPATAAPRKQ